jgi:CRISPR/Cas system-associated exonuclease Cas4 (RecB family)
LGPKEVLLIEEISMKKILLDGYLRTRGQRRNGFHVSDLMHCLRRTAFCRLDNDPPKPSERTLHFWIGGTIRHLNVQELLGPDFEYEKEITYTCKNGITIVGHCDAVYKDGAIIELKTTGSSKVGHEPYQYHILQLAMYMAILNVPQGILLYLIQGSENNIKDYFPEYHLTMDEPQRRSILKKIEMLATELQMSMDKKDANLVSHHVANNPTYMNKSCQNWYCSGCPYRAKCSAYHEYFESERPSEEVELERALKKLKQQLASNDYK